jgi:hypothetical protein
LPVQLLGEALVFVAGNCVFTPCFNASVILVCALPGTITNNPTPH